jgi:hypothetical protein
VRRRVERREATVAGSQGVHVCCCGWFNSVVRAAARRVEGEEEGVELEGAGNGGVLLMKSVYLNKCEALDMRRFNLGAACAGVRRGITKGGRVCSGSFKRDQATCSKCRTESRFLSQCCCLLGPPKEDSTCCFMLLIYSNDIAQYAGGCHRPRVIQTSTSSSFSAAPPTPPPPSFFDHTF